jgi:glycosyltransferase involved in cell wall biosynthesis
MFFSIVIPTYNRDKIIPRAINSILKQSFTDFEIIVVDDGSTDNTEAVVSGFNSKQIRYFKTANFGVAHARNYGIKQATGAYIGFLDSDDLMEMVHLQTAYDFIRLKNNPGIIHLNFLWGDEDKSNTHKNYLPRQLPGDIFKNCSLHVNCIFAENKLLQNNLFNDSRELMFAEDWDFFIKLAVRFPIHTSDVTTAYLIDHEDRNMRNFNEEKWVIKRDAISRSLREDEVVSQKYLKKVGAVTAHMNSLIAVNFAVRKSKIKSMKYWFLALSQNFNELFTMRSLAIMKHLALKW